MRLEVQRRARGDGWRYPGAEHGRDRNPEMPICTLDSADARLEMELVVETGKGYVPAESKEDQPIGQIPVDAIFTPVRAGQLSWSRTRASAR